MTNSLPGYLCWPHMHADQVRGLRLRELGGGFTKHHRAPSTRAACYAIAKPSTLAQKMQFFKTTRGHQNAVYCATFDRTGRYVITGSDVRLMKVWSTETAFCLASCRGHEGDITDLAVSYTNTLVASSSNDFIIRVWRLPDGLPISVLKGHNGTITAIAFSPCSVYQLLSYWWKWEMEQDREYLEMYKRESNNNCWNRKERVMRNREKRQIRHYYKKIRYEKQGKEANQALLSMTVKP